MLMKLHVLALHSVSHSNVMFLQSNDKAVSGLMDPQERLVGVRVQGLTQA